MVNDMKDRKIVCLAGELEGAEILVYPGEQIVIGREPSFSNLVFLDITVSRKHCVIELDTLGEYYVTDYSECGLITEDGVPFVRATKTKCQLETVLLIGRAGTKIILK